MEPEKKELKLIQEDDAHAGDTIELDINEILKKVKEELFKDGNTTPQQKNSKGD